MKTLCLPLIIWLIVLSPVAMAAWPHGGPNETPYCTACHSVHGASEDHLLRGGTVMCSSCHSFQGPEGLWPGIELYDQSVHSGLCTQCHNPHGVTDEYGKTPHLTSKRGAELCFDCHQELDEEFYQAQVREEEGYLSSKHPVQVIGTEVTCSYCHNPHIIQSKVDGWEARVTNPNKPNQRVPFSSNMVINKFCISCHNGSREVAPDILSEIKGTGQPSAFFALSTQESLHRAHLTKTHVQNCLLCHKPHTSEGTASIDRGHLLYGMKVRHFSQGYPGYNSCETTCHGERCSSCHPTPPFEVDHSDSY